MSAWLWITQRDAGIRTLALSPCKQSLLVGGRNPCEAHILPTSSLSRGGPNNVLLVRVCVRLPLCFTRTVHDAGSH